MTKELTKEMTTERPLTGQAVWITCPKCGRQMITYKLVDQDGKEWWPEPCVCICTWSPGDELTLGELDSGPVSVALYDPEDETME